MFTFCTTVLDVEKPRDIKTVNSASIPFNMGSTIKVNNVTGAPLSILVVMKLMLLN